jgi:uncharacterized protein YecE (DUF72 family)
VSLRVGTSGWSYPTWRPDFYPAATDPSAFLPLYAARFDTVELNSTGYRLPSEGQFATWAEQVPETFRFAVKAPRWTVRRIDTVQERVRMLGERLGCIRLVVPTPRDDGLLELLLGSVDPAIRWALDLRDTSWDGVETRLADVGAVRVDDWQAQAGWCYVRFRDPPYDEAALDRLAAKIRPLVDAGADVFAFFRHEAEPTAPRYAQRLRDLVA